MEPSKYTSDLAVVLSRTASLLTERVTAGVLPAVSRLGVWSTIISHIIERFVEGVSRVKKCSPAGRGLMLLDIGTIYAAAAKAAPLLPGCLSRDKSHADNYLRAFYYDSEIDLVAWIKERHEAYPLRHAKALLINALGAKKKLSRETLVAVELFYIVPPTDDERIKQQVLSGASLAGGALERFGAAMIGAQ